MATRLKLSMLGKANELAMPILDGSIEIEGVELEWVDPDAETLTRRPAAQDFGLVETSLAAFLTERERGSQAWLIPVFPNRGFPHTRLAARPDAGITGPRDLAGKRVGVQSDAAALWTRAVLEHDFGAPGAEVRVLSGDPAAALANGEVDAAPRASSANGAMKALFPSAIDEGSRYFKEHGFVPALGTYTLNADLYAQQPWLAFNIYKAFLNAKDVYRQRLGRLVPSGLIFGAEYLRRTRQLFGEDPFPDGVRKNRAMLEQALGYAAEQGLTKTSVRIEDLVPAQLVEF